MSNPIQEPVITSTITGSFIRRLNSADTNYYVCLYRAEKKDQISLLPTEIREKNSSKKQCDFIVIGYELPTFSGVDIKFSGEWIKNKYGTNFKVSTYEIITPETKEGIYQYLINGRIKGVGPTMARAIVDKFGTQTLQVLEDSPEKLLSIRGIGEKKLEGIIHSYKTNAHLNKISIFLSQYGLGMDKASILYRELGLDCIELIQGNPFCIMDIDGFGFGIADKIARSMKIMLSSDERICAAILQVFEQVKSFGDLYCDITTLKAKALKLLNEGLHPEPVSSNLYDDCFIRLRQKGKIIVRCKSLVFSAQTERVERDLAIDVYTKILYNKVNAKYSTRFIDELGDWKNRHPKIELSSQQENAILTGLSNNISVITGYPGTGKTMITKIILEITQKLFPDKEIILLASTGRAASRMSEVTGMPAHTIHRRLGIFKTKKDESESTEELPENGLIIVDEFSMVDIFIANILFRSIPLSSQLIMIGDADQLPSVGPGNVLRELIRSKQVPVARLDQIFRQGPSSLISENCARINRGERTLKSDKNFRYFSTNNELEAQSWVTELYNTEVARVGPDNVAVLCPMRKKGIISVEELNKKIQSILNPPTEGKMSITINGTEFRTGDRIIQTKNTELFCNGDVGTLKGITFSTNEDGEKETQFHISFNGEDTLYTKEQMKHVDLAYALTIHKSQGSEYKSVIVPILSSTPDVLLKRNLLYTAVSRAKENCYIIGEADSIGQCISTNDVDQRKTLLADRIHNHFKIKPPQAGA